MQKKLRVVFPYPQPYGAFPDIYEYVENLRKKGVDALYIGWKPKESRLQFLHKIASEIKNTKPDIVHVFHFRGAGVLPLLVRDNKIRWIIDVRTIHVENSRLEPERHPWLKTRITWLDAQIYEHIFVLTPTIKKYLLPSLRPITMVPLGASAKLLETGLKSKKRTEVRSALGIPGNAKVLLYSGALSPSRRIDYVIKAFAKLREHRENVHLLFIGGIRSVGADKERVIIKSYTNLCEQLCVQEYVHFTGWQPYQEALKLYVATDIGIVYLPPDTPFSLQPPTKLIEYMMAGLLSVGNDVPGITEFIEDCKTGILCGNTVDDLAYGMKRALQLLDVPDILENIKRNALEKVRNRDWSYIVEDFVLPTYRKVLR